MKKKYKVYLYTQFSNGDEHRMVAGETWAVSPKAAINNVRYRSEGKLPNFGRVGNCNYYYKVEALT